MSTDVVTELDPVTVTAHDFSQSGADFEAALNANKQPETKAPETKPEKPEAEKPDGSDLPDELLTGVKPEPKKELSDFDKVLNEEPPERLSKEGKANWARVRDSAKHFKEQVDSLKSQLAEAQKNKGNGQPDEATATELKTHRERVKELESIIEKSHFEKSERFKYFLDREAAQIDGAKKYLEGTEVDPNAIELAAKASGKKRIEILKDAGADTDLIAAISPYLAQYDATQIDKKNALDNYRQVAEQDAANQRRTEEARAAQQRENEDKVFKAVGLEVANSFEPFKKLEGEQYAKWNAQVDELNNQAQQFFSGDMPLEKVAEIAYYGVGAKVIHEMNGRLRAKLKAANEELASLKAAQPSVKDTDTANTTKTTDDGNFFDGALARAQAAFAR